MASEIRVDKINSLSGVGTVTLSPTGVDIAGITTTATLKATTGIVTTLTATTGIVTTLTANTTKITTGIVTTLTATTGIVTTLTTNTLTANSTAKVGSGVTISPDGDVFATGVTTCLGTSVAGNVIVGAAVTITSTGIVASGLGINCANINGGQIGRRNIVINGAMRINQRGTSSHTINSGNTNAYVVDRFNVRTNDGTIVASRDTDAPSGFDNSIKLDVTVADASLGTSGETYIQYLPESRDLTHLAYGTSGAKTVTFSFYVKSNLATTFGFYYYVADAARAYQTTFSISSANTWERKVITVAGDTTGNGFNNDNGIGAEIRLYLAGGSNLTGSSNQNAWGTNASNRLPSATNILSSTDNNFYMTGFQMEVGNQATPFEHRLQCEELALCQRYYQIISSTTTSTLGFYGNNSVFYTHSKSFHTQMRDAPGTATYNYDGGGTNYWVEPGIQAFSANSTTGITLSATDNSFFMYQTRQAGNSNPTRITTYVWEPSWSALLDAEF